MLHVSMIAGRAIEVSQVKGATPCSVFSLISLTNAIDKSTNPLYYIPNHILVCHTILIVPIAKASKRDRFSLPIHIELKTLE